MKKLVNVYPKTSIYGTEFPILSNCLNIKLSIGDIRTCLNLRARVEEILKNGQKINLNFQNFDKDNNTVEKKETKPDTPKKPVEQSPNVKPVTLNIEDKDEKETKPESKVVNVSTSNTNDKKPPLVANSIKQVNANSIKEAQEKLNKIKK